MDGSPPPSPQWRWWPLAILIVTLGQAGLALQMFGPNQRLTGLTDSRPILSGRHPLHLYHGSLGAAAFAELYTTSCYDPAFQAGYPKTPVFDSGARPAELFLSFSSDPTHAGAYKIGLWFICLSVPGLFALAARGFDLSPAGACLASVGGCLVWWSPPIRALLDEGNLDLLLAGLAALTCLSGFSRYASDPGPVSWAILACGAWLGWFANPVAWLGMFPIVAAFYIAVAPRQGLAWHLGMIGAGLAGVVPNLWWLWDWCRYWWMRQPSTDDLAPLPSWAVFLGRPDEYADWPGPGFFGWVFVCLGVLGLLGMVRQGLRTQAGLIAVAAALTILAARLGATWPTIQAFGADRALGFTPAALVIPAAWLIGSWWERAEVGAAAVWASLLVPIVFGWVTLTSPLAALLDLRIHPLPLGLSPDQHELVEGLKKHTTPEARILIEDTEPSHIGWNWTALLPTLTHRMYLGGLDPEAGMEHSFCGLKPGKLNCRTFPEWKDHDRRDFYQRYNVGWVLCRSASSKDWIARDPLAHEVARFREGGDVLVLLELSRVRSYVLTGSAILERADRRKLVLTDVKPNAEGEVVLSFHHQPGFRAAPANVWVEAEKDLFDPVPMIKLRLPGPVSRVTLSWENP